MTFQAPTRASVASASVSRPTLAVAVLALLLAMLAVAPQARAQDATTHGDWTRQCQEVQGQTRCAISQVVSNEQGQPMARVTMGPLGPNGETLMVAQVPLGVHLPSGLVGRVDEGQQFNLTYQRCVPGGCQGGAPVTAQLEQALKAGQTLRIGFKFQPQGQTVVFPVSLSGITAGLNSL